MIVASVVLALLVLSIVAYRIFGESSAQQLEGPVGVSGKWQVEATYLIPGAAKSKLDKLFGRGELWVHFNEQTRTFSGLGWIAQRKKYDSRDEALTDPDAVRICFEVLGARQDPDENIWIIDTQTLFRSNSSESGLGMVKCTMEFPAPMITKSWTGKGKCPMPNSNSKIEIEIELRKLSG